MAERNIKRFGVSIEEKLPGKFVILSTGHNLEE